MHFQCYLKLHHTKLFQSLEHRPVGPSVLKILFRGEELVDELEAVFFFEGLEVANCFCFGECGGSTTGDRFGVVCLGFAIIYNLTGMHSGTLRLRCKLSGGVIGFLSRTFFGSMPGILAPEASFFFDTFLLFFDCELPDLDCVDVHCIWVALTLRVVIVASLCESSPVLLCFGIL